MLKDTSTSTVQEWVDKYKNKNIKAFLPHAVESALGISPKEALDELDKLVREGQLLKKYNLICDCGRTIIDDVDIYTLPIETQCEFCLQEHEVNFISYLTPLYSFVK